MISCRLLTPEPEPAAGVEQSVAQTMAAMETEQSPEELVTPPASPGQDDVDDIDDQDDELDSDLSTATNTLTPEPTDTVIVTEASCDPTVQVSVNTNCRVGPGQDYARVGSLLVGQTARVIGRNADSTYWIIERPGGAGHCWLWGAHATVTCETTDLAIYEPPPTPTPIPPTATHTPTNTSTPRLPTATHTPTATATIDQSGPSFWCDTSLVLSPDSYIDLENCSRLSSTGGHLLYTANLFRPLSSTRLGLTNIHDVTITDCEQLSVGHGEIHRDTIGFSSRVCFRTSNNRFGYFYIVEMDQPFIDWIKIHVRTWLTHR